MPEAELNQFASGGCRLRYFRVPLRVLWVSCILLAQNATISSSSSAEIVQKYH